MRDLLMTFKTFKKYCCYRWYNNPSTCGIIYNQNDDTEKDDKENLCNKKNCPVVKRTRL